jgi:Mg-chelatase subunit ChlD
VAVGLRSRPGGRSRGYRHRGKSPRPDGGHQLPLTKEGEDADAAIADSSRKTTSRRDLSRNPRFEQVSPEVGELDEEAVQDGLSDDPDEMMAMLADLTAATDPKLRALAKRLAAQLYLEVSRRGALRPRGIGKLVTLPYSPDGGDLDIDASIDAIAAAHGGRSAIDPDGMRIRGWAKPGTALCLIVDRSGSMGGKPLATSAVAAAAVAWRCPEDYSVLAFGKDIVVAKSQDGHKDSERVVNDVLSLRGFGTTDVAGALQVAQRQVLRSRAGRRIAVLLSDCRATVDGDVLAAAAALEELVIIAPTGDSDEADKLAGAVGARIRTVSGPSEVAAALSSLLDD